MEFGTVYIGWIKYLKKEKLFSEYRITYSSVAHYLDRLMSAAFCGCTLELPKKFVTYGKDNIISNTGHSMSIFDLMGSMRRLDYYQNYLRKCKASSWETKAYDYGLEVGLIPRPSLKQEENDETLWSYCSGYYASDATSTERNSQHNTANIGQWYDRFYNHGNRRHINNRRNINVININRIR